ncbi:alanine:cation symporter family protein [Halobacillus mangrovi]|uniref:alanine:cation symporter family protein n=1 Tax=Halobacillus mangrovi TaxID=402384 RepID=UPI003D9652D9
MAFVLIDSASIKSLVWKMADLFMALMKVINLVAIGLLGKVAFKVLTDYEMQRKEGKMSKRKSGHLIIERKKAWDLPNLFNAFIMYFSSFLISHVI